MIAVVGLLGLTFLVVVVVGVMYFSGRRKKSDEKAEGIQGATTPVRTEGRQD